jgi:hypothetical protein
LQALVQQLDAGVDMATPTMFLAGQLWCVVEIGTSPDGTIKHIGRKGNNGGARPRRPLAVRFRRLPALEYAPYAPWWGEVRKVGALFG